MDGSAAVCEEDNLGEAVRTVDFDDLQLEEEMMREDWMSVHLTGFFPDPYEK